MENRKPLTILCVASYEKGHEFMRECKRQGCRVILLTSASLQNADWPRENLDDIFYIPDDNHMWNLQDVIKGVSYLARAEQFDRIVALDDFDVEKAATLREHLRVPGMGDTTARYFRDKLAMRVRAKEIGLPVPEFVHILNYNEITEYFNAVPPPYILKPRMLAGAIGMKKLGSSEEAWQTINALGDQQSFYLIERFVPGTIYHVDSIIREKTVAFAVASEYAHPPLEVSHSGKVFISRTMLRGSEDEQALLALNEKVLTALGLVRGVSHTEFIKGDDGTFYFLETSARAGGAHIVELVEAATGLNLWQEWARIETMLNPEAYTVPEYRTDYAGLLLSLAKHEWPDMSTFSEAEVVWRLNKRHHAGLIVKSTDFDRITALISQYSERFYSEFFATQPPKEMPTD